MTEEEFTDGYGPSGRRGGAHAGRPGSHARRR